MTDSRKNMPILVSGGAGYIGSMLVQLLLDTGHSVRVIDCLNFGGQSLSFAAKNERLKLHEADIRDKSAVDRAMDGVSAVVHLAAIVGEPACNKDEEVARSVNGEGSRLIYRSAIEHGVERFVFASTCSNYGRMKNHGMMVNETAELQPLSVYSETKVEFEQLLLASSETGMHPTCLRFATAFGLSHRPRFDLTVNEFTRELVLGRKLEIYGEQFWRPYCHVKDIARACLTILEAPSDRVSRRAFNVGDNQENYQKRSLVELIEQRVPGCSELVSFVQKEHDMRDYRVCFDRINSELDFRIKMRVPDGIDEIVSAIRDRTLSDPDNRRYCNV